MKETIPTKEMSTEARAAIWATIITAVFVLLCWLGYLFLGAYVAFLGFCVILLIAMIWSIVYASIT